MSEFDLIATYFTWEESENLSNTVIKGVGDDAAVLALKTNQHLVTSIDTLISGVHFPEDTAPYDIGHKALAVNLSDLAAMGANPEWFTLALTLPEIDHQWLSEFSHGLKNLANEKEITLVGGDTTSGPLAISIQVMGSVESGKALYRNGAKSGDKIYVTGTLGDSAAGLASIKKSLELSNEHAEYCQRRLNCPTPRNTESELIKEFASACIDVSDGLLQDLTHILDQSKAKLAIHDLGARLDLSKIPLSKALQSLSFDQALEFALTGGDDYELLFTVPEKNESQFLELVEKRSSRFTCFGTITNKNKIVDINDNALEMNGYNHFL